MSSHDMMELFDGVVRLGRDRRAQPAVVHLRPGGGSETTTYGDLAARARRFARYLATAAPDAQIIPLYLTTITYRQLVDGLQPQGALPALTGYGRRLQSGPILGAIWGMSVQASPDRGLRPGIVLWNSPQFAPVNMVHEIIRGIWFLGKC